MEFTDEIIEAAQENNDLQTFLFKVSMEGLNYALTNYYGAPAAAAAAAAAAALREISPDIAARFDAAAGLMEAVERDLERLEEASIYTVA